MGAGNVAEGASDFRPPRTAPVVWVALALLAAVPCVLAVAQLGRVHDDEVFQFLEPALFRARGYGILAWEWRAGLRNWALPGLLSALLSLTDRLGVESPRIYRAVLELPGFLLHLGALWAVFRYASRRLPPPGAAFVALCLGLYGPLVAYAGRTLGEAYSTGLLLIALEALTRDGARPWLSGLWGGAAVGLSVVARYGSAVFAIAAIAWLLARRRFRLALACAVGGLGVAAALGALDWATWGQPFHSLLAYVRFNVLSGGAEGQFGKEAWYFFVPWLLKLTPVWAWLGLVRASRGRSPGGERLSLGLSMALAYLFAISIVGHKEERFVYPAVVLLALEGAVGLFPLIEGATGRARALQGAAVLLSFAPYPLFSAVRGDQFRSVVAATRGPDVRGLLLINEGVWGSPGYFYMGKPVPFTVCDWPSPACDSLIRDPRINRVSTYDGGGIEALQSVGFRVMAQIGHATWLAR